MALSENKQLVGSLTKGLIILEMLMENESMGVTEIANILQVNKSSAYRLLITLVARGFVIHDEQTGKYRIGDRFSMHPSGEIDNEQLNAIASPYLRKLTGLTNESSAIAVMAEDEGILVGITSGAALAATVRLLRMPENAEKTLVALLPDSGDRYFSTPIFE